MEEYVRNRKVERAKSETKQKVNERDFGKRSRPFRYVNNLFELKEGLFTAKKEEDELRATFYVTQPKKITAFDRTVFR